MMPDVPGREASGRGNLSRQEAVREGLPCDDSDVCLAGLGERFANPFLPQHAERDLERRRPARLDAEGRFQRLMDRDPVVENLVLRFQALEDLVRLRIAHHLRRRVVELVQIDVIRAQPFERPLEGEGDVPGVEVHPDAPVVEVSADLRRDAHLFAAALEGLSEDLLAVSPAVHVRRVEEGAPELDRPAHGGDGGRVVGRTVRVPAVVPADRPCAEANLGDLQTCASERPVPHPSRTERGK